jgi:hypothetical protein
MGISGGTYWFVLRQAEKRNGNESEGRSHDTSHRRRQYMGIYSQACSSRGNANQSGGSGIVQISMLYCEKDGNVKDRRWSNEGYMLE